MVQREDGFGCFSRSDGDEKIQKCAGNLTQISGDFVLRVSGDSILAPNVRFDMADNDMYVCIYYNKYMHNICIYIIILYTCIEILKYSSMGVQTNT